MKTQHGFAKDIQELVHLQVEINRAVFAANITEFPGGSFKTNEEREEYIKKRIEAMKVHLKSL